MQSISESSWAVVQKVHSSDRATLGGTGVVAIKMLNSSKIKPWPARESHKALISMRFWMRLCVRNVPGPSPLLHNWIICRAGGLEMITGFILARYLEKLSAQASPGVLQGCCSPRSSTRPAGSAPGTWTQPARAKWPGDSAERLAQWSQEARAAGRTPRPNNNGPASWLRGPQAYNIGQNWWHTPPPPPLPPPCSV